MEKIIGYARVSMTTQDLALQIDALHSSGVKDGDIYVEKVSGSLRKEERPQFDLCMQTLREGDTLVVWKLDRIGRSLKEIISILQELRDRKIDIKSITEAIDTTTNIGKLHINIISCFAEYERNLIRERTMAGLEAARKRGVRGGRKYKLNKKQQAMLVAMYKDNVPIKDISQQLEISKSCIYSYLHLNNAIHQKKNE